MVAARRGIRRRRPPSAAVEVPEPRGLPAVAALPRAPRPAAGLAEVQAAIEVSEQSQRRALAARRRWVAALTTLAGPETPGLGCPTGAAGAVAPTAGLEPGAAPGAAGAADPGGVAPGASLAFGLTAPGGDTAALGGAGGAPLAPGTGSALVLGKGWVEGSAPGAFAGCVAFGLPVCPAGAPGKPVLTAGLIAALGGTGALPCWISVALCATAGGSVGVAPTLPRRNRHGRRAGASDSLGAKSGTPGPAAGQTRLRRPVDDVVDDGPVVDVGKDDVVRRRRHIAPAPAHRPVSAQRSAAAG